MTSPTDGGSPGETGTDGGDLDGQEPTIEDRLTAVEERQKAIIRLVAHSQGHVSQELLALLN